MKLDRLPYDPAALVTFYEEGFTSLGALSERTWHDRLEIVAQGEPAKLWNPGGALHEVELVFAPADATSARDAAREVFPGCPLTFRLAEALRPAPLPLERVVLAGQGPARPPDAAVAEKLWRAQFGNPARWCLAAPFKAAFHFSLLALVRCEIQAIDQHWSLRRLAFALPEGQPDESLAQSLSLAQTDPAPQDIPWPAPDLERWMAFLRAALEADLAPDLAAIRTRQENYLRRELDRIDEYFQSYERELSARAARSASQGAKLKTADRLAAARAEHTRRRADQVARHEIRVQPQIDALLLAAEPAWSATIQADAARQTQTLEARFVPRARRWFKEGPVQDVS
ncbi:MAG: hypothetical protein ABSH34_27965 [Verrucomicrobiota bacterium]|jgi:hypothetical protein